MKMRLKSTALSPWLSVLASVFFLSLLSEGAPLKNVPVTVRQPNGVDLHLLASGDEFYNWLHDANGYTIIRDPQTGYYVYALKKDGVLVSSGQVVTTDRTFNLAVLASLNIPKYLMVSPEKRKSPEALFPDGSPANPAKIQAAPKTGVINNLVIFIRFSGESEFTDKISLYDDMFNQSVADTNSMSNYFKDAAYNLLSITTTFYPTPSTTVASYQDSQPRTYYQPYNASTNPSGYQNDTEKTTREHTLLKNAVEAVESQVPDGLNIDGNSDGRVDNVCFIIYGNVDAWDDLLWPHMWSLTTYSVYINSKRVYTYNFQLQAATKSSGVGVLCHEMCHSLGFPDLYHYSFDGLHPAYSWDLMENDENPPQHMLAYMKYRYGTWISPIPQITTPGTYSLNPLRSSTGNCYRMASPYSPNEYFVVEYRKKLGIFESSLPGEGLLVYRINTAIDGHGNDGGPPDEVYIYRPNGTPTADGNPSQANFNADSGRTSINDGTNPSSFLSEGGYGGLNIYNISAVGDTISFTVGSVPVNTYLLKVSSTKPGATILVSPTDIYGNGSGKTIFSRLFNAGTAVTLTAPSPVESMYFVRWTLDGAHYSNKVTTQLTMNGPHTLSAVYGIDLGEAVDNPELVWTTTGKGWFGQGSVYYNDIDAAQSSDISNNEETALQTTIKGPGDLSFYWKVSSEQDYDYLNFYINDVFYARISGEIDWQKKAYVFGPGVYTLKWLYWKDEYVDSGSDCAWVDKVTWNGKSLAKEDPLGTWDGQGVYYRNPNPATWVKLATPADLIASGDLDGDGIDDLIGIWPGQGGVWVRYSKTGNWAKISSTAKHISSADMNGDGRDDLLGTWDGQGVFYRDSVSGTWAKLATPASLIAAGDCDADTIDDLIGIWPGQGGVWVKYSKTGTWEKLSSTARDIAAGDMNADGKDDLVGTWDGQGVYYRNSATGTWVKMSNPADHVTAGEIDEDGKDDLIGIWASQGGMYVKYSTTGTWDYLASTARDIWAGRMKEGFWGLGKKFEPAEGLPTPKGGLAESPRNLSEYEDLTEVGPGGKAFRFRKGKNLVPLERPGLQKSPGPGEAGFVCLEENNLVPQAEKAKETPKRGQGNRGKEETDRNIDR